jgi:hypothetical protein
MSNKPSNICSENNNGCYFQVLVKKLPSGLLTVVNSKVLAWMFDLLIKVKVWTTKLIKYY